MTQTHVSLIVFHRTETDSSVTPPLCFFALQFPDNLPCSVALQPAPHDVGKVRTCGQTGADEALDGDASSSLSPCSNVPWSSRSKRSARRARTLKFASGESDSFGHRK